LGDQTASAYTIILPVREDGTPASSIERAAELLREGRLVAFPTETVYGLGANALNAKAVAGIFAAKGRPFNDPLIVHIASSDQLGDIVQRVPDIAHELARRFWPGPLTMILPRKARVPVVVAAGGDTIGVRVPSHPVAQALLHAAAIPVAAPSANRFMHTSPTTAEHVLADLDGKIDCVLDGGPATVGVESTVLDVTVSPPRILRPGGVSLEALRTVVPDVLAPALADTTTSSGDTTARAPGQMERHYAPHTRLIVFDGTVEHTLAAIRQESVRALAENKRVGLLLPDDDLLGFLDLPVVRESLGPANNADEVARKLYSALRALDSQGLDLILTRMFDSAGLGLALRDRLRRAAGGRVSHV